MRDRGLRRAFHDTHGGPGREGVSHAQDMTRDGSAPAAGASASVRSERVGLNKYTLRFTDTDLEHGYQRARWARCVRARVWPVPLRDSAM